MNNLWMIVFSLLFAILVLASFSDWIGSVAVAISVLHHSKRQFNVKVDCVTVVVRRSAKPLTD